MAELDTGCCTPAAQAQCCEPEDKAVCCGSRGDGCGCAAGESASTQEIRETVREKYAAAAVAARSGARPTCCGPADGTGTFGASLYDPSEDAPENAINASLGCGVPTAVADLGEGETVLDLGSGGGADVLISARRVGPGGRAIGLDMTDEMLDLARRNAAEAGVENVEFVKGYLEDLPLADESVDVVLSNCVVNLSGDKPQSAHRSRTRAAARRSIRRLRRDRRPRHGRCDQGRHDRLDRLHRRRPDRDRVPRRSRRRRARGGRDSPDAPGPRTRRGRDHPCSQADRRSGRAVVRSRSGVSARYARLPGCGRLRARCADPTLCCTECGSSGLCAPGAHGWSPSSSMRCSSAGSRDLFAHPRDDHAPPDAPSGFGRRRSRTRPSRSAGGRTASIPARSESTPTETAGRRCS